MEGRNKIIIAVGAITFVLLAGVLTVNRDQLMGNVSHISETGGSTVDVTLDEAQTDVFGFDIDTSQPSALVNDVESYEAQVADNLRTAESNYTIGSDAVNLLDYEKYYSSLAALGVDLSDSNDLHEQTESIVWALNRKLTSLKAEKEQLESVSSSTSEDYDALLAEQQELIDELEDANALVAETASLYAAANLNYLTKEDYFDIAYDEYTRCINFYDGKEYNGECGELYLTVGERLTELESARAELVVAELEYEEAVELYDQLEAQLDGITAFLVFYHQGSAETEEEISRLKTKIITLGMSVGKVEAAEVRMLSDIEKIQSYYSDLLDQEATLLSADDDELDTDEDSDPQEDEEEDDDEEEPAEEDEIYDLSIDSVEYDEDSSELEIEICATNLSSSWGGVLLVSIDGEESANLVTLEQDGCPEAILVIELEGYDLEDNESFDVTVSLNESNLSEESEQANNFASESFVFEDLTVQEEPEEEEEDDNDRRYGHPFYDVDGHWGEPYVDEAYSYGWVQGTGGGRFEPNRYVNTAEYIKLMAETHGFEDYTVSESEFSIDIPSWLERYVLALEAQDVIRVRDGLITNFADEISRCDAALYLARLYDVEYYLDGNSTGFNDVDSSLYCAYAIVGLNELGVINGYPDGSFRPDNTLTRAEALSLLMNAREAL